MVKYDLLNFLKPDFPRYFCGIINDQAWIFTPRILKAR